MAELADALYSGCSIQMDVQIQLLFRAQSANLSCNFMNSLQIVFFLLICTSMCFAQTRIDLRSLKEKADEAFSQKNYKESEKLYSQWSAALPRDTTVYLNWFKSCLRNQNHAEALNVLKLAGQAGVGNFSSYIGDTDYTDIKNKQEAEKLIAELKKNFDKNDDFPLRYTEQTRIGRYRILYPPNYNPANKYHLGLVLHGNSQDPNIILRWAKELKLEDFIFVCPEAPYVKVKETVWSGKMRLSAAGEELGVPDSNKSDIVEYSARWYVNVLNDAEKSLPVYRETRTLIGFSQGGFYAGVLATRFPHKFKTTIMMCASYYDFGRNADRWWVLNKYGIDVLHVHGKSDPTVPFQTAELLHSQLESVGVKNTFLPFEGGHWMSPDITVKIADWITEHNP